MVKFIRITLIFLSIFIIHARCCGATDNENTENHYPYVKIGSKYYFINESLKLNWFAAYDYCRSYGDDLAHVESRDELLALQTYLLPRNISIRFWMDGNDLATEGKYMSHTTGRPLLYTNWLVNNPSDTNNEDCLELYFHGPTLFINDNDCGYESYAVCQYRESTKHCSGTDTLLQSNEHCLLRNFVAAFMRAADVSNACAPTALQPTV